MAAEMQTEVINSGFKVLDKVVAKTSHKHKIFNIVPLGMFVLIVFLILLVLAPKLNIARELINQFFIISIVIIVVSAAGFLIQDFLDIKRIQVQQNAHNQQFKKEYQ